MNPDNRDFAILGNEVFVVALIVVLFISGGVLLRLLVASFHERIEDEETARDVVGPFGG